MIKEQVLETLAGLGYTAKEIHPSIYSFEYDGLNFLYAPDEEETHCLPLIAPDIYDITATNRGAVLEAMARLSASVKYVQPAIMFESELWLNYQHYLGDNSVTPELIEHMLKALFYAAVTFNEIVEE